ncbi:hypothetical protein C2869_18325 [Saccharobesus litoralis]|uniref:PsiF repeat-containing protein n=1 Tax=Saccharobesus litoralis TaxID=2172099 RepID=A0A2S0VVK0_9ALTE|nr:hypothetical protein [Saccharobesus litoralis]AWB68247.1 hypothetical protein C2869_18325 [Saccharobesus litoralis]
MKKIAIAVVSMVLACSQFAWAGDKKPSKEERKALAKECKAEAKEQGIDLKDKKARQAYMGKCIKAKFNA